MYLINCDATQKHMLEQIIPCEKTTLPYIPLIFMTILRKFPTEIHRQILELLPRKTVYQCILVCKHWSLLAIPVYYTTLTLSGKQIDFLNIKLLHHEQDQQFLHGKLVKVLKTPEFINENEIRYR